ncbi:efflux transporter outer membrane subunit [Pseudomonas orientalis]|uniref:Outer membrane protein, multidrug efflux system n=1 Tax=Pseudomonas orientalis TaxID=76758 RepID=A0A1H2EB76_9PSED|nr:TolC family protein [Pseudomonas orientalis]KRP66988.1 membrane protein [Pseudomonas orientalis]SDT92283.1 outer membrane protein, multidrug efflux system [Pseudomonas orientalis]
MKPGKTVTTVLALTLLNGCMVGPHYEKPTTPPISLVTAQKALFAQQAPAQAQWWSFFDDAELDHLIDTALAHNHDIRQAQANLLASRAVFDDRRLDQYPGVTARTAYGRSLEQQLPFDGGPPERMLSQTYRAGFDVQWEIDVFGRLQRLTASAMARSQAAQADLALMQLSIAADVARYYYEQQGLSRSLEVAQAQVSAWRETLTLTSAQVRAGSGQFEDQQNAHANLLLSEAAIPPLLTRIQETGYRLDVLTGQPPRQQQALAKAHFLAPLARQLPLGDVDQLIRNRPDVVSAERMLAASTEDVGVATADLYPRLNLGGFIGFFALRGGDLGSASRAYELAPSVDWPAFRLGNVRARLRASQAQAEGALARYQQSLLKAQEDVENALMRLAQDQTRLGALLASATHAEQAIDIASKRYRSGSGTYMAVLENQRAFFLIKKDVADAETASYLNAIALYKALGWGSGGAAQAQSADKPLASN